MRPFEPEPPYRRMDAAAQPAPYRPETAILALGPDFYDPVAAGGFPAGDPALPQRAAGRGRRAGRVLATSDWIAPLRPLRAACRTISRSRWRCAITATSSACTIPTSATAAASCSRSCATRQGRLLDLGTKGSGQTPYSRFGDGRLTLKGGVREILATEMLEALGVETSKTFSLIETGEALERDDEPSPTRSAVLVRLSHSHIRIGTFQRLAYARRDRQSRASSPITACAIITADEQAATRPRLLGHVVGASRPPRRLLHGRRLRPRRAQHRQYQRSPARASTTARGASRPTWDGAFTAAYFDHAGLYAFGRQPEAIHWDLVQLAIALRLIERRRAADRGARGLPAPLPDRRCATRSSPRLGVQAGELAVDMRARLRSRGDACGHTGLRSTASSSTGAAAGRPPEGL